MDFPLSAWRSGAELGLSEPNAAVASNRRNYQPEFGLGSRRVPPRRWRWVIWRIVRKAIFHTDERRRLTKEAREYMALRSKRKKFVAEQKAAKPAPLPVNSGD